MTGRPISCPKAPGGSNSWRTQADWMGLERDFPPKLTSRKLPQAFSHRFRLSRALKSSRKAERQFANVETAKRFISEFFDKLTQKISKDSSTSELFSFEIVAHSDFQEPTTRAFIARVLSGEKRPDSFVTALVVRPRDPLGIYSIASMLNPSEEQTKYELTLNCSLEKAQLKITLVPKFVTLKQLVLVITCAPSLQVCYVFEMLTQHSLRDWGAYDLDGEEIVRRWYKMNWTQDSDSVVEGILERSPRQRTRASMQLSRPSKARPEHLQRRGETKRFRSPRDSINAKMPSHSSMLITLESRLAFRDPRTSVCQWMNSGRAALSSVAAQFRCDRPSGVKTPVVVVRFGTRPGPGPAQRALRHLGARACRRFGSVPPLSPTARDRGHPSVKSPAPQALPFNGKAYGAAAFFNSCYFCTAGNPAAMVVAAALQAGCPQPLALTPMGRPDGLVMS